MTNTCRRSKRQKAWGIEARPGGQQHMTLPSALVNSFLKIRKQSHHSILLASCLLPLCKAKMQREKTPQSLSVAVFWELSRTANLSRQNSPELAKLSLPGHLSSEAKNTLRQAPRNAFTRRKIWVPEQQEQVTTALSFLFQHMLGVRCRKQELAALQKSTSAYIQRKAQQNYIKAESELQKPHPLCIFFIFSVCENLCEVEIIAFIIDSAIRASH